ncbi:MAG: nucleotide exchange factor GrpE [Candidatus Paceibacterota bacterium]
MKKRDEHEASPEAHEDIDFEPEDELGSVGAVNAKMKKLKDELQEVKTQRQEYLDGWQRSKADSVNLRRELMLDAQRAGEKAREALIEDIIAPLDSFDMATGAAAWQSMDPEWTRGIDQIRNQFLDVLRRHGIERFGRIGEAYDPRLHDAVEERDDIAGEPGSIVRILRFGYKSGERVIRPAQVVIKKFEE